MITARAVTNEVGERRVSSLISGTSTAALESFRISRSGYAMTRRYPQDEFVVRSSEMKLGDLLGVLGPYGDIAHSVFESGLPLTTGVRQYERRVKGEMPVKELRTRSERFFMVKGRVYACRLSRSH